MNLTPFQLEVMANAAARAEFGIKEFERRLGDLPPSFRQAIVPMIASAEIGFAREVAQMDANQRAEIARMTDEQVVKVLLDKIQ